MTEKDVKEKEVQSEKIDPRLKELIEIMKLIQKEMPNADPSIIITIFLRYLEEQKHNNFGIVKQNPMNSTNIESLVNSLSFKQAKNGKSEFVKIEKDLGAKLPQRFTVGEYDYINKIDALIRVKNNSKQ